MDRITYSAHTRCCIYFNDTLAVFFVGADDEYGRLYLMNRSECTVHNNTLVMDSYPTRAVSGEVALKKKGDNTLIKPYQNHEFIVLWKNSYELLIDGVVVLCIDNRKEQFISLSDKIGE